MRNPLFLVALLLLALNDHVLKGSGLFDAAITGKLSDFTGLLVAPLVIAWLLSVRSKRGWLACHAVVGAGFIALQCAPVAAALTETGIGRFWADPTDLVALPVLAVSFLWLRPSPHARPRRTNHLIGAVALVFCVASGQNHAPPRYPFPPAGRLRADVVIRHLASEDLEVTVRRVRDEVELDCDRLRTRPDHEIDSAELTDEQSWSLARGDAIPLWDRRSGAVDRDCYAVRIRARDHEWIVVWQHGEPAVRDVDIRLDVGEQSEPDEIIIANDGSDPPTVPTAVRVWRPN